MDSTARDGASQGFSPGFLSSTYNGELLKSSSNQAFLSNMTDMEAFGIRRSARIGMINSSSLAA
jgi:hypothetical protein